ncbi:MAG: hypothetical protein DDT26_01840 [Dehalococcoidia bacterium]|nr:hypothetical protein [Chloroflexota bacterium]
MQALAARQQLASRLWPTQQQQTECRELPTGEFEGARRDVFEAERAGTVHAPRESLGFETAQGARHLTDFQCHHRFAGGFLVCRLRGGILGERVLLGCGGFFLDQATQQAGLGGIEQ